MSSAAAARCCCRASHARAGASASGGGSVQVKIQKRKRWATVASAQTDPSGQFSVCAKVSVPANAKVARLRATTEGGTGTTTVRVGKKGPSGCGGETAAPAGRRLRPARRPRPATPTAPSPSPTPRSA